MTSLVLGATGATGRLLVAQLLERGGHVRAIVRAPEKLPHPLRQHDRLSLIHAAVSELSDADLARHVQGCGAVASCLGHNLNLAGIYGPPRKLVTEAVTRLCHAIQAGGQVASPPAPVRFVLMNTTGNRNRDLPEPRSFGERCVIGLLRLLLPPHCDNEEAADYLRTEIGPDHRAIEWAAVRPDTLKDEDRVTAYTLHPSPTRRALFNPGATSRINVAHFMADLMTNDAAWSRWKGQMPVIYNEASPG